MSSKNQIIDIFKSSVKIKDVARQIKRKPSVTHLYVFGIQNCNSARVVPPKCQTAIREININDITLIDELTEVDEWKIAKSVTLNSLQNEWRCFVGMVQGRIVGCVWTFLGANFDDLYLKRRFYLNPNEAYFYRCFCTPEFRGNGILPFLWGSTCRDILPGMGKTAALAITRAKNKPMIRGYAKMGWSLVGRIGIIELAGVRLNYLWGKNAFELNKNKKIFFN